MNMFIIAITGLVCVYFYALSAMAFVKLICPPSCSNRLKILFGISWPLMLPLSAGREVGYARLEGDALVRARDIQSGRDEVLTDVLGILITMRDDYQECGDKIPAIVVEMAIQKLDREGLL